MEENNDTSSLIEIATDQLRKRVWGGRYSPAPTSFYSRARLCKGAQEPIPPAYVALRGGMSNRVSYRPARLGIDSWPP